MTYSKNNKFIHSVEQTVKAFEMFKPKDSVLVGVSGGPDSVALLYVLLALASTFSLRIGVAHLNHCLRQDDSDKDAEFVASLARKLNLPCYITKKDVRRYQQKNKLSLEEAARSVRYAFLNNVAERNRFNKIALGHHSDDNAELVLMYIFRGSGPLGISGIPPKRDEKIVRPLIRSTRSEVIEFLSENRLRYVSDSSNTDRKYLRNKIRHELIPSLKASYNPRITETLNRLASIIRREDEWIEDIITPIFEKSALAVEGDKIVLSVQRLDGIHIAAKRRVIRKAIKRIKGDLRRITLTHIDSTISLLEKGPAYACLDLPDRIRIRKKRNILILSREKSALRSLDVKSIDGETLFFEYKISKPGALFIKEINTQLKLSETGIENLHDVHGTGHQIAFFDMDNLAFPLVVRNFRPGDRFTPLGMTGTQKVKKYFINNKVPRTERERCPLLLSQGKIIWVVGYRIDDFVKIKSSTKNVLKAELFLA